MWVMGLVLLLSWLVRGASCHVGDGLCLGFGLVGSLGRLPCGALPRRTWVPLDCGSVLGGIEIGGCTPLRNPCNAASVPWQPA